MNFPWAIRLARSDAASIASLRLAPGIEAAESEPFVWLRGGPPGDPLARALRALPAIAHYEVLPDNRLREIEKRIPSDRLPDLRWQPLSVWLQVEFPAAAMPVGVPAPVPLQLIRSSVERDPDVLLVRLEEWSRYVLHAPQVRLERLQFAASDTGEVLVRGTPLPPLPGRRFVTQCGVAVPAGFSWSPAVSEEVLARCFGAAGEALVLWHENGAISRLHAEHFVPASRSAVRATDESHANPS